MEKKNKGDERERRQRDLGFDPIKTWDQIHYELTFLKGVMNLICQASDQVDAIEAASDGCATRIEALHVLIDDVFTKLRSNGAFGPFWDDEKGKMVTKKAA